MAGLSLCVLILLSTIAVDVGDSARILVIQPTPARGHTIVTEPLFAELAARGHHLTVVTSYPHTPAVPNLLEIDVSVETDAKRWLSNITVDSIRENMPNQFRCPLFMAEFDYGLCEVVYSSGKLDHILNSNESFDMVLTEIFTNDCFVPFAAKFSAPLVSVVTSHPLPWTADRVGLPDNPAYIPNYYVDLGSEMNFSERVYNTVFLIYTKLFYYFVNIPNAQNLVDKYFGHDVPPIAEIVKNTSLILMNSYFSLSLSRPLTPNVVEIGGIHIKNTTARIPEDLQDILDSSSRGALVVSFGSMIRVASLPDHVTHVFLASFAKLPQTVILKYESQLSDIPDNVIVRKWLPQKEIMGHKNVKAVMVHGGLASTTEAMYYGKPLVGVPFFSDQFLNIKTITRLGAGVLLNLDDITEESLDSALHAVLNDPRYTERARQLSAQFRDRPLTPLQTAVFWLEYVLRHKGAPQLRPSSVTLAPHQYLLLDIVLVLAVGLSVVFWVLCRLRL